MSNVKTDYNFDDKKSIEGNNYYRLKMVGENGNFQYSNIVLLKVAIKGINITGIYPTPFINKINVDVMSNVNGQMNMRLFDNTGKMVAVQTKQISSGNNSVAFDGLGNIAKGFYMIEIRSGETIKTQKLLKQ